MLRKRVGNMYWVSDTLIRMKNANSNGKPNVVVKGTKFCLEILRVLKESGYIFDYKNDEKQNCTVTLKYYKRAPLVKNIKFISTPKNRRYGSWKEFSKYMKGFKTLVVSTTSGVMTGNEAISRQIGGEMLFWIDIDMDKRF